MRMQNRNICAVDPAVTVVTFPRHRQFQKDHSKGTGWMVLAPLYWHFFRIDPLKARR